MDFKAMMTLAHKAINDDRPGTLVEDFGSYYNGITETTLIGDAGIDSLGYIHVLLNFADEYEIDEDLLAEGDYPPLKSPLADLLFYLSEKESGEKAAPNATSPGAFCLQE